MKIATQTDTLARNFGELEAVKILSQIGYDRLDYSIFSITNPNHPTYNENFREHIKSLKAAANEYGVTFNQSHAPFPSYREGSKEGNEKYNEDIIGLIIKSMEITSILGAEYMIVHPITLSDKSKQKDFNMEFYNSLVPYCKKFNVKIALENMWGWDSENKCVCPAACSTEEEFVDYLDTLGREHFAACLDVGHSDMQGAGATTVGMIKALGNERLKCLHIHDNDTVSDLHMLPFTQKLKWQEIAIALKEIKYNGDFTFESDNFMGRFPKEVMSDVSKLMLSVGKYFVETYKL